MSFRTKSLSLILLALISLFSCSGDFVVEKFVAESDLKYTQEFLMKIRDGDYEYVRSQLHQDVLPNATDEVLETMTEYFRKGELLNAEPIGASIFINGDTWRGNLTFEFQFSDGWNVANAVVLKRDGKVQVGGMHVHQTFASQKEIHSFLNNFRSLEQGLLILAQLTVLIFITTTVYTAWKTPIPKRKWAWILFILLGFGAIQMNWSTGELDLIYLNISLFAAAASRASSSAPWFLTVSVPIGALVFWHKYSSWMKAGTAIDDSEVFTQND